MTLRWRQCGQKWPKIRSKNAKNGQKNKVTTAPENIQNFNQIFIKVHKNTQIPLRILPGAFTDCTLSQVETSIWLGAAHPQQAFQLLCLTAGTGKIEYLLQTMSLPNLTQQLADLCSNNLRATYASILQVPPY